jgi:hypothetical protein
LRTVALLSEEPTAKIATRTAGAIEFEARLAWRSQEDMPPEPILPELLLGSARCTIVAAGQDGVTRHLAGEIRAFTPSRLASALEAVLRSITTLAALTEAVLEVGAARSVQPAYPSPLALEVLARDLSGAGFPVHFGPSWALAPAGADVCVGTGGEVHEFLRAHPAWGVT